MPKSLPTATWDRILQPEHFEGVLSYTLYDKKARPVRLHTVAEGDETQIDTKFNFIGDPVYTETTHIKNSAQVEIEIREDFTYTDQSRLLEHTHRVNDHPLTTLSSNEYDVLGNLIAKEVGSDEEDSRPLQVIDYKYNIRGWLTDTRCPKF